MNLGKAAATRVTMLAAVFFICSCTTLALRAQRNDEQAVSHIFDMPLLLASYHKNNQQEVPVVSYMKNGAPQVLVYPDGKVLTKAPKERSRSGLMVAHASTNEVAAFLASVVSLQGFHRLSNQYELTLWSDQPLHRVKVRLTNGFEKSISVYGRLGNPRPDDKAAPTEFLKLVEHLLRFQPAPSAPFDPGYVEINFADYSYAPEMSLPWPKGWPALSSPLVRDIKGLVIEKTMIFPSAHLEELDSFLKKRPSMGAILIDGWKASGSYRWPLPGEKQWTAWDQ